MPVKLIAMDMDGTALNEHHQISAGLKETLALAKARGIVIALASGRHTPGLLPFFEELQLTPGKDLLITCGGALSFRPGDDSFVQQHLLDLDLIGQIAQIAGQSHLQMQVSTGDEIFSLCPAIHGYTLAEAFLTHMPLSYRPVEELPRDLSYLKAVICGDPLHIEGAREAFPQEMTCLLTTAKSTADNLEIISCKANKGQALADFCRHENIDPGEVFAIGDNENDLSMLEFAGYSVAMGNALPIVKQTAAHLTESNKNGGVAKAIQRLVFGD